MTRSDDTHENEANMTPEEMKNELRYLRAENAYLKAMQEHLLEKKRQELEKKESHPEPEVRTLPV
ncbi:Putative Transposase [Escherichia coli]|uniref:Transposase n=1 Tax=Escherichia coli TaxID=562 RepID=A0A376SBF5_ECOLX|nr:Putative Transposase [Escherichia coli]